MENKLKHIKLWESFEMEDIDDDILEHPNSYYERGHKINSIKKVIEILGLYPNDIEVIDFIKNNYDLNNEGNTDIVADIMGFYKIPPEEYFDDNGNLLG